jgi:replication factor C small subunit
LVSELAEAQEIWVEKYRPKKLSDIAGQDDVVDRLKTFAREKSLPHLLFAGPPGNGKTTAALCIVRELFGEGWQRNFLELNASDERGIDTIRTKVKNYARSGAIGEVPYRIVYLDESDALTSDAQHALRRTMEKYTRTTRFILACNYSSKIIEPIQSRCAVFRFRRLAEKDISKVLKNIAKSEKLNLADKAVDAIIHVSEGDMRRAINLLQAASTLGKQITEKTVYDVSATAHPEDVKEMMKLALDGKFEEARKKLLDLLIGQGLAGDDVLRQVHRQIFDLDLPEPVKVKLIDRMGEFDFRLTEGANEQIQLEAALAHLALIGDRLRS